MKTILKRLSVVLLLGGLVMVASAKDIYLSSAGKDKNDGTTTATAVKTLCKALSIAERGDVIKISGFIDITKEPVEDKYGNGCFNKNGNQGVFIPDKDLTFIGDNRETCGFDGKSSAARGTCCLRLYWIGKTTFKNLTIKNGDPRGDKGAGVYICSGVHTFENCAFINNRNFALNTACTRGGAIFYDGNNAQSKITLKNCIFKDNMNKEGSDIFLYCGGLLAENCKFEGTDATMFKGSEGGVLKTNAEGQFSDIVFRNCIIKNYKVEAKGGVFFLRHIRSEGYPINLRVEECMIYNNEAQNHQGGVCALSYGTPAGVDHIAFINTTIAGSKSKRGGAIMLEKSADATSTLDLINCTITGNHAELGGGVRIDNGAQGIVKHIYNCVIEGNIEKGEYPSDISIQYNTPDNKELVIKNSYIGCERSGKLSADMKTGNVFDYESDKFVLADKPDTYIIKYNCIPLKEGSSAFIYGDPQYLKNVGIAVDQLQKTRPFINNKCAVGAVESVTAK